MTESSSAGILAELCDQGNAAWILKDFEVILEKSFLFFYLEFPVSGMALPEVQL